MYLPSCAYVFLSAYNKMALHCLDLGISRFLQFSATLVLPGEADLEHLRGTAVELLKAWPSLQERVNLLVRIFLDTLATII